MIPTNATKIRVFVACTTSEWLPMRVLEFSMRETSRYPVELISISSVKRDYPLPKDLHNKPRTPFSFQRFLIPELCGYTGRAIYLDADMQLFSDIGDLWDHPMGDCDLLSVQERGDGRKGQFSVMVLNCERLRWRIEDIIADLDAGRYSYEDLMFGMCVAPSIERSISPQWNSLEKYQAGITRLLHYTDMDTQPWVSILNPRGHLWVDCLRRALNEHFISREELTREIEAGHVRPSLLAEVQNEKLSVTEARKLDSRFVPPYKLIRSGKSHPWASWRGALKVQSQRLIDRFIR